MTTLDETHETSSYGPRWEPSTKELKATAEELLKQVDAYTLHGLDAGEQDLADLSACLLLLRARGWVPARGPDGLAWGITSLHPMTAHWADVAEDAGI